jgi:hypothetical protein
MHLLRGGKLAAWHQAQHQLPPVAVRLLNHNPAAIQAIKQQNYAYIICLA